MGSHIWEVEARECLVHRELSCASREQGSQKRTQQESQDWQQNGVPCGGSSPTQMETREQNWSWSGTQSQVKLGNTTVWAWLVRPVPRESRALTVLLNAAWSNTKGFPKPPSKLTWTITKSPVNTSYHSFWNGIQMGHQVLYTKLNQLMPPRMNKSKKASFKGKTSQRPGQLDKKIQTIAVLMPRVQKLWGPWLKHQLSLLPAIDSQTSQLTPLDPFACL